MPARKKNNITNATLQCLPTSPHHRIAAKKAAKEAGVFEKKQKGKGSKNPYAGQKKKGKASINPHTGKKDAKWTAKGK